MSPPTFFFSYARQDDWGNYLSRFFFDLERTVAQWSGHPLSQSHLGTIDIRIEAGTDWSDLLSEGLTNGSAFVMAETPSYYRRPECGKELRAFLRRCAQLGIDAAGALTGARNVFRVRWMPETAYNIPPGIPSILARIEYTPPRVADDDDRNEAIQRYLKKGMKNCVDRQPYYNELLDAFAEAIVNAAGHLPPGAPIAFDTEDNAFQFDWHGLFQAPPQAPPQEAAPSTKSEPEGLRSVVAFHITDRQLPVASEAPSFADVVIDECASDAPVDTGLAGILAELRRAAIEENLQLFNVAPAPPLPFDEVRLAEQLRALTDRGVSTLLIIDPQWLLALPDGERAGQLRDLLGAVPGWPGATVVADGDGSAAQALVPTDGPFAVPGAVVLPKEPAARGFDLQRVLVEARGRTMRSLASRSGDAQALPLLSGSQSKAA